MIIINAEILLRGFLLIQRDLVKIFSNLYNIRSRLVKSLIIKYVNYKASCEAGVPVKPKRLAWQGDLALAKLILKKLDEKTHLVYLQFLIKPSDPEIQFIAGNQGEDHAEY